MAVARAAARKLMAVPHSLIGQALGFCALVRGRAVFCTHFMSRVLRSTLVHVVLLLAAGAVTCCHGQRRWRRRELLLGFFSLATQHLREMRLFDPLQSPSGACLRALLVYRVMKL